MKLRVITSSPSQTKKFGKVLAEQILKTKPKKKAFVIGLIGDLGGGKTTFLQGFAKGLGIRKRVLSPTFIILKRFKIPGLRFETFYHIDCYRIDEPEEVLNLGFKEIISNSGNIVALEWAEKIKEILPKDALILKFVFLSKQTREIVIKRGSLNG